MQATTASGGVVGDVHLKMDDRAYRVRVHQGNENKYLATGWEVADDASFQAAIQKIKASGTAVEVLPLADALALGFQAVARFQDPAANTHELVWGYRTTFDRFISPVGVKKFITDPMGMGHVVLPAPNFDETWKFLNEVLGFELADIFRMKFTPDPAEPEKRIYFLHCGNARHHSLAIFEMGNPAGCVHAMVEVEDMDEVGRAYDRMLHNNVKLMATLGRHVNDRMTSFYMDSPSGFAIEFGFGGLQVDWDEHLVFETTKVSLWGHDFSVGFK
ncbi:unnamed protein product [Darwinula stevensoni]|uniref:VOC domain-containing protein n=1 Tax=Darwinula stevensoni TaxID=69355 RepID=A0A7R9FTP9_9CRUS|nr:unnamed protein product [Darwinula stevensoni]CAG0906036.1 unnamed protein product [Darwinula stevensoni]